MWRSSKIFLRERRLSERFADSDSTCKMMAMLQTNKLNLRLLAFGDLARTVSIPREMKNGVDLDLFAALGFANIPKVKKYATKIQKFLSLLCKHLFHDGTLLEGRRVEKANQPEVKAQIGFRSATGTSEIRNRLCD